MKSILTLAALGFVAALTVGLAQADHPKKVEIDHWNELLGEHEVLCINRNGLNGHAHHQDREGMEDDLRLDDDAVCEHVEDLAQ